MEKIAVLKALREIGLVPVRVYPDNNQKMRCSGPTKGH